MQVFATLYILDATDNKIIIHLYSTAYIARAYQPFSDTSGRPFRVKYGKPLFLDRSYRYIPVAP